MVTHTVNNNDQDVLFSVAYLTAICISKYRVGVSTCLQQHGYRNGVAAHNRHHQYSQLMMSMRGHKDEEVQHEHNVALATTTYLGSPSAIIHNVNIRTCLKNHCSHVVITTSYGK